MGPSASARALFILLALSMLALPRGARAAPAHLTVHELLDLKALGFNVASTWTQVGAALNQAKPVVALQPAPIVLQTWTSLGKH